MSDYTDVIEQESPEFIWPFDGSATVMISKVGGGSIGESYEGRWEYWCFEGNNLIHHNEDLFTGTPKTHKEAIEILLDFISDGSIIIPG